MEAELRRRAARLERGALARAGREAERRARAGERAREAAERARAEAEARSAARAAAAAEREEAELVRERQAAGVGGGRGAWGGEFRAGALPEGAAAARGVRRGEDKVALPPSALRALENCGATLKGAMLFELRAICVEAEGGLTHCSVLAFDAPEGQVLLPAKVARSLWGSAEPPGGQTLSVLYKPLPKAQGAKLQPVQSLPEDIAPHIRDLLEEELERHCTLTVGDSFEVAGGVQVRVRGLEPAAAVSLVGTEIAVDLLPSVENEEEIGRAEARQAAAQAHAQQRAEALAAVAAQVQAGRRVAKQDSEPGPASDGDGDKGPARAPEVEEEVDEPADEISAAALEAAQQRLPPEPSEDSGEEVCTLQVSLPGSGEKAARRFSLKAPAGNAHLHDFVTVISAGRLRDSNFQIVSRMPRRVLPRDASLSLLEAGLAGGSSALMVELC